LTAAICLWLASYVWVPHLLVYRLHSNGRGVSRYEVQAVHGKIEFSRYAHSVYPGYIPPPGQLGDRRIPEYVVQLRDPTWIGFTFAHRGYRIEGRMPCWSLAALGLILLTLAIRRRLGLPGPNQCQRCRYDLTGNTSGVCPECGTTISTSVILDGVSSGGTRRTEETVT
jgi:hypothetical protein